MSKTLGSLTVGAKIEVPVLSAYQSRFGSKIVFKIADKNHSGYPSNSVTLITEKIIQLMCFDAKEPSNSNSDRKQYGNNRYQHSNILQWLNSNATAGAWHSAKHSADAPPTNANVWNNYNEYDAWAGFLAMLDPKFVAELLTTTQTVARNTVTDGGSYETVTSKMFLASTTEVGLANENNIAEGTLLALFSNNASRVAYPTAQCVSNSEYTDANFSTSKGWYWWLRTPYSSDAHSVRCVNSDGSLSYSNACNGGGGVLWQLQRRRHVVRRAEREVADGRPLLRRKAHEPRADLRERPVPAQAADQVIAHRVPRQLRGLARARREAQRRLVARRVQREQRLAQALRRAGDENDLRRAVAGHGLGRGQQRAFVGAFFLCYFFGHMHHSKYLP